VSCDLSGLSIAQTCRIRSESAAIAVAVAVPEGRLAGSSSPTVAATDLLGLIQPADLGRRPDEALHAAKRDGRKPAA